MSLQHTEQHRPEISVIIPIYNGNKYIDKLISSLKKQTYKDYDVLFIDDGSEDNSYEKLSKYRNGADTIIHIYQQENKGQGEARNLGIEKAKGKWLCFMDQDDAIEADYFERLHNEVEKASENTFDILISGYRKLSASGRIIECVRFTNSEWCRYMNIAPWGKLYRRDFVIENNIRYSPLILGEDIFFNVCAYMAARRIKYTDYVGYSWIMNNESVSNSVHIKATKEINILKLFDCLLAMDGFDEWKKEDMNAYFLLKTGIFHVLYSIAQTDIDKVMVYEDDVFKWLTKHIDGIEKNKLISLGKPVGERFYIRFIVYIYMLCRRMRLNTFLLSMISVISKKNKQKENI